MTSGDLNVPGWSLVAVPVVYHLIVKGVKAWRGAEQHFVTKENHEHFERERNQKCDTCQKELNDLKAALVPRQELERIFKEINEKLDERKSKTHKLRGTLNKIVFRQHEMHLMVVAIGTKVGADQAMEEAVRKAREMRLTPPDDVEDDEVDPI